MSPQTSTLKSNPSKKQYEADTKPSFASFLLHLFLNPEDGGD
jgi:hypothetical protein